MSNEPPAPLLQVGDAAVGDRRVNHDASDASLRAGGVLEDQVFDVDRRLAELAEEAPEGPRLVGDQHLDLAVARRRAAVLTGDARDPLVARGHHTINRPDAPPAQRPQFDGRIQVEQKLVEVGAQLAQHLGHGARVARENRRP